MKLVKFDNRYRVPANNLFTNDLNEVFESFWNQFGENFGSGNQPDANIIETEKSFIIELSVPGFKKDEISVKVENNVLSVSHELKEESEHDDTRYVRREFVKAGFVRNFRLSRWVNADDIKANFKDGILRIEVQKKDEIISKPVREIKIS